MAELDNIIHLLCCPDDYAKLLIEDGSLLSCSRCGRHFIINENIIDLRPSSKADVGEENLVSAKYHQLYHNLLDTGSLGKDRPPFGLVSRSVSPGFFQETATHLQERMSKDFFVCDVGAGSGDYSIELAKSCKLIFHCDLDVNAIAVAHNNAMAKGICNIFFVRCDYFHLPFIPRGLDYVYAIDVLERGTKHDRHLLGEMVRITKIGGHVAFDCHSKERSKLTKVQGTGDRYSREEIITMARKHSLKVVCVSGTGFIPQLRIWSIAEYQFLNFCAKLFRFPPARWLISCRMV